MVQTNALPSSSDVTELAHLISLVPCLYDFVTDVSRDDDAGASAGAILAAVSSATVLPSSTTTTDSGCDTSELAV